MNRPQALDLFCKAGGASMGLHRAGFDVTGVDIEPQPRYPFRFIQADALSFSLKGFHFIWASPVCKLYSSLRHYGTNRLQDSSKRWPNQIPEILGRLNGASALWCIENVPRAPLDTPLFLCGQMFGLPLIRHRKIKCNFPIGVPSHRCAQRGATIRKEVYCIVGNGGGARAKSASNRRMDWRLRDGQRALGIEWMTRAELAQAVPPCYSEYVGQQAMEFIQ